MDEQWIAERPVKELLQSSQGEIMAPWSRLIAMYVESIEVSKYTLEVFPMDLLMVWAQVLRGNEDVFKEIL